MLKDTDYDAIKNSLENIISTIQGSRRMLPTFAMDIHKLLFEPIDEITADLIGNRLVESIEVWDDRVLIDGLEIEPKYDDNMYKCRMKFQILGLETPDSDPLTINFILKQI
jgi:phage baseplate assembly protein W